jgi:hypothetical protein
VREDLVDDLCERTGRVDGDCAAGLHSSAMTSLWASTGSASAGSATRRKSIGWSISSQLAGSPVSSESKPVTSGIASVS